MEAEFDDVAAEIADRHGDTSVSTLRRIYGSAFGIGVDGRRKIGEAIRSLDAPSFEALVRDYKSGYLFGPVTSR